MIILNRSISSSKKKIKILQLSENGHELTKDIVREGSFFGDLINKNTKINEYGKVISDDLVYLSLTPQRFEELSHEIPRIAINFSHEITRKLKNREARYSSLVSDSVKTRLVDFFTDWANVEGQQESSQVMLRNYLTHNIANLISTCRQTVTSILNTLKSQGNIQYSRSWIVIPDLNRLKLTLGGNSLI